MLKVSGISRSFGGKQVLGGVSFELDDGSICGLVGPSGSGKSVLLKIMGKVLKSDAGDIDYSQVAAAQDGSSSIGLMFQEGALFDSLSVLDNVAFPLVSGKVPASLLPRKQRVEIFDKVVSILTHVGLKRAVYKMPSQLSGGMRRRVALARALVSRPPLVLLDDPTAGLDPVASSVIMDLIVNLQREYKPMLLIVSHDLRRLFPVVQKIYALYDGVIQFTGTLEDLRVQAPPFLRSFVACRYELDGQRTAAAAH